MILFKKNIFIFFLCFFSFTFFSSCSYFMNFMDNNEYDVINVKSPHLNIAFSNNIHGETHPCGCRHFPLGGLPQVAGKFHQLKKTGDFIYVDTGDTLFSTSILPKWLKKSLIFSAKNLAQGLDRLGLQYFVPGEKDFAGGMEFLVELSHLVKFKFLISNLKDPKTISHKKFAKVQYGPHRIYFLGIVAPETLGQNAHYFKAPHLAIKETINLISQDGYRQNNPFHRLIILSHSGMEEDKKIAQLFPKIDWIIGSHTQSFTTSPMAIGKTRLVQALSRNHYIGNIIINFKKDKQHDTFKLHEIRDELSKNISPNPFDDFIIKHKEKIAQLQSAEQMDNMDVSGQKDPFKTANSCLSCHGPQGEFWQKTAHSLAFSTLLKANEQSNLACVKCHTLGEGNKRGFYKTHDIVQFEEPAHKSYWNQVKKALSPIKSVRKLAPLKRQQYSKKWQKIDDKMGVTHNFSNVQCLNCHSKAGDHPFEENTVKINPKRRREGIKKNCLSCHDGDQSPHWYKKNAKGLSSTLDEKKFKQHYKKLSCPKFQ